MKDNAALGTKVNSTLKKSQSAEQQKDTNKDTDKQNKETTANKQDTDKQIKETTANKQEQDKQGQEKIVKKEEKERSKQNVKKAAIAIPSNMNQEAATVITKKDDIESLFQQMYQPFNLNGVEDTPAAMLTISGLKIENGQIKTSNVKVFDETH